MKKQNKLVKSKQNKNTDRKTSSKYPLLIPVCLGETVAGLHINFIITKEGKKYGSSMILTMADEIISGYDLIRAEPVFWPIMERLNRAQNSLRKQVKK